MACILQFFYLIRIHLRLNIKPTEVSTLFFRCNSICV